MSACPICETPSHAKHGDTPYNVCAICGCWWQHPFPPKRYTGPHEPAPEIMTDGDKKVNADLVEWIFRDVMRGVPGYVLDVGSRYPYLAHCLAGHGCDSFGLEHEPIPHDLNVVTLPGCDFEEWRGASKPKFDLITLVHVFEHLYDPIAAMRKLRRLVSDTGRVFIRLPDNSVPGFERDLTPGHYTIHPFYHCLASVCQILAQLGDAFVVEQTTAMDGYGQRDIVLRPVRRAPTIGLGMIVKNEARDLPRFLKSAESVIDGGVIVDTGSTDGTPAIATTTIDKPIALFRYLEASSFVNGDWRLINFGKARNEFVRHVRGAGYDWLFWADADDEIMTPASIRRAAYLPPMAIGMWIDLGGGARQVHYRMWPAKEPIEFKGWCHEYPVLTDIRSAVLNDICIRHDGTPTGAGEDSNQRNLRILTAEYAAEPSARTAFYLANTHKDAGRFEQAARWYNVRLGYGSEFRDEYLFAILYLVRSLRQIGDTVAARNACTYGLSLAPDWAELRMELAFDAYTAKDYDQAIVQASMAIDQPPPPTPLWRERAMYGDQPARLISWCHQQKGELRAALAWSDIAGKRIVGEDVDWQVRDRGLRNDIANGVIHAPAILMGRRERIALHRPGAIGDILMTLNLLPAFREANPDADVHYFCNASLAAQDALGSTIAAAGAHMVLDAAGLPGWRKSYDRVIDLVGYPIAEGYPEKPIRRHLLEYFGEEMGLSFTDLPALTLPLPKKQRFLPDDIGAYLTVQGAAGWSKYKQWPGDKIHSLVLDLRASGFRVEYINESRGLSLRESIALFANARMHIGIDSFANHLTNYFWQDEHGNGHRVPGVILWGSTQASAAGYPSNVNISKGLPCQPCFKEDPAISRQPRGACINPLRFSYADDKPHACMAAITVEEVVEAALTLWRSLEPRRQDAA